MPIRVNLQENKRYEKVSLIETHSIFNGYYGNFNVDESILKKLSRDLGFSYDLYLSLNHMNPSASDALIDSMVEHSDHREINLLLNEQENSVVGYSLDVERSPILNTEFFKRVYSMIEAQDFLEIDESYYHPEDITSSILVKRIKPISVEKKYVDKPSEYVDYQVGILLVNDENNSAYSRLVMYIDGQPLYLPASYYSATTTRYRRSTSNSLEALELLVLKTVDDLREDTLYEKIKEVHYKYDAIKHIVISYEEYSSLLKAMRKIPSIIDDQSFLESLSSRYENFEKKYPQLDDKKSSYIWRCTAFSTLDVSTLISITSSILSDLRAPVCEYFNVREILGSYVSTSRIVQEIASESGSVK